MEIESPPPPAQQLFVVDPHPKIIVAPPYACKPVCVLYVCIHVLYVVACWFVYMANSMLV